MTAWTQGSPVDWANESHSIAVRFIYGSFPHDPGRLPDSYQQAALPTVNDRLERAGVRLAMILNRALP